MPCCEKILEASKHLTGCECEASGYCNRHSMHKHDVWHRLCKTDHGYFTQYEQGVGPGQVFTDSGSLESPHPTAHVVAGRRTIYLGDFLAYWIGKMGFKSWAGCGCDSRRAYLNRFRLWP